ncbi:alternative ribosome rescue aminoacyl-tRNA hydrolase ArfB [Sphingomonas sp.]|uniref:alternative ribosome rescue aminoacyl-tRNA hydrolase ArfB n=1 Tax=Sphingomonas sp. TaxID=28214 RepID=UPI000DB3D016|nr:alternative ribosome rescue aminoacyl-tRNA hydrolase ArfB [Sphingomonas sp.]PZU11726.1 MAG: aminoacyl-tRNA hydrolase [Sphingomonas sp.]
MASPEPPPLPEGALEERFLAATGPGGQNVNKVATACQLRLDVYALGLAPDVFARLKMLAGSRWSAGSILVTARRFRTREANREDARARLAEMVAQAHIRPERRVKTKPSKAAKARRVEAKSQRGAIKQGRAKPRIE